MAELTYQTTGYAGTNVIHSAAAITAVSESFNKANGNLGPDLTWTRAVFTHAFPFQVNTNQCRMAATSPGTYEDIQIPSPTVDTPNVTLTVNITAASHTGSSGDYIVDTGGIFRYQSRDSGTNYRGYAFAVGRNNVFLAGVDTWHFAVARIDSTTQNQFLSIALASLAGVTLPGTLTMTAEGPYLSGTFTHAGSAGTLTISATDTTYTDGSTVLGGSASIVGTDTVSIDSDVWAVIGDDATVAPDPRGFLWVKNTDASPKTVTVTVPGFTVGVPRPDTPITVPATDERMIGPLVPELAVVAGGRPIVAVNYSNVTGVSAAAVRVP